MVGPEWQLVKAHRLLGEAFATDGAWDVFPHVFQSEPLHLHEQIPSVALIVDRFFEPSELFGTEGNSNGFCPDSPGPLIARAALARLVAFDQTS